MIRDQANILVSKRGEPMLCDFGLAVVVEDLTMMSISTVLQGSGNCRWMAIELLFHDVLPTKESDMWAFGMVVLEVRVEIYTHLQCYIRI